MEILKQTIAAIEPVNHALAYDVNERLAKIMEGDENTLGRLKDLLLRYLCITQERHPVSPELATIICCSDHGVAAEGVSAYPQATTVQMVQNYLISQGAAANAFADFADSNLMIADLGIAADTSNLPGLLDCHIANGTQNMAKGPAMTREQAVQSIESGILIAEQCFKNGIDCLLPGEMGIANTTASAAITAVLCHKTPEETTGRGTNIDDERLQKKIAVVKQALAVNQPDANDGLDVLAKVGGFEFGAIAGLILGAAAHHKPVLLDGANTAAAALIAQALAPACTDYLLASQLSTEKSHAYSLTKLGLTPVMRLNISLSEGCGSSLLADLLEALMTAWDVLDHLPEDPVETPFHHEFMPRQILPVSDKTFDFYLRTMQGLDRESMNLCQERLNHLAKPIYSLGYLEQIDTELAGIIGDELPEMGQDAALLCFTGRVTNALQSQLTAAFTGYADASVTMAHLKEDLPPTAAFDFGREHGEFLALSYPLLGLAVTELDENTPFGTASQVLKGALLNEDSSLKYPADEFLQHVPKAYQNLCAALIGAIIAAAHNCSFILLDDEVTEIVARYTEKLCPDVRPYILHLQPQLLQLNATLPGGIIASLGLRLTEASLFMLNEMKTFRETNVSPANNGPGATGQE